MPKSSSSNKRALKSLLPYNQWGLTELALNELPPKRARTQHWNVVPRVIPVEHVVPVVPVVPVEPVSVMSDDWWYAWAGIADELLKVGSMPAHDVSDSNVSDDNNNANKIRHADTINWSDFSIFIKADTTNPMRAQGLLINFAEEFKQAT